MAKTSTFLWFDDQAEEAARHYTSIFPNSEITELVRYGTTGPGVEGSVMTVRFDLDGVPYTALNGGPEYQFTEAISLWVDCADQEEVDYYWSRLSEGGQEVACGWLKDRYGLAWQVVPRQLPELLADPDPGRSQRAMKAMMGMVKLDVAALRRAADG